jgi:hypothetical protein
MAIIDTLKLARALHDKGGFTQAAAGRQRVETTDGRYVKVADDEWWDVTGVDLVPDSVVEAYMQANRVGWIVTELPDEDAPTAH